MMGPLDGHLDQQLGPRLALHIGQAEGGKVKAGRPSLWLRGSKQKPSGWAAASCTLWMAKGSRSAAHPASPLHTCHTGGGMVPYMSCSCDQVTSPSLPYRKNWYVRNSMATSESSYT